VKFIYLCLAAVVVIGCSGEQVANGITRAQIAMAGNRPPVSFRVANLQTMKEYVFHLKGYDIAMPDAKEEDFKHNRWQGFVHYNKDLVLVLDPYYHISVSTNYYPQKVGKIERAIQTKDISYIRSNIKIDPTDKLYIARLGKEKYLCKVMEYTRDNYPNSRYVGYDCYKFNPDRTKYRNVSIRLTYHKPQDPKLARIYTYRDLKQRARRMLESLYIKHWW